MVACKLLHTFALQVIALAKRHNWEVSQEMLEVVSKSFSSMGSSHLPELGFQRLRSAEQAGGNSNRKLAVKAQWARLVDSLLPSVDHNFQEVPWSTTAVPRGEHWCEATAHMHKPCMKKVPAELQAVASYDRIPSWYSPKAAYTIQAAVDLDLYLVHGFQMPGKFGMVNNLWQCLLLQGRLLVRDVQKHDSQTWFFVLGDMGGRCAAIWPALKDTVGGTAVYTPDLSIQEKDVAFMYTHDSSHIQAMAYEWRSPAHLAAKGGLGDQGAVAVAGPAASLLEVSASKAFGKISLTVLRQLAKHMGLDTVGADMFETLRALVSHCLPNLSEAEVLEILSQRLDTNSLLEDFIMDDAFTDHLQEQGDIDDLQEVERLAEEEKAKMKGMSLFKSSFRKAASTVRAKAASTPSASASSSSKGDQSKQRGKKRLPTKPPEITEDVTEQQLQPWLPDSRYHIWKDSYNCRRLWYYNSKPQRSCSWLKWGGLKPAAAKLVYLAWAFHQSLGGDAPPFQVDDVPEP